MSWTFEPEFDAAHRAALAAGKPLVYAAVPAVWATLPLFARLSAAQAGRPPLLVLVPTLPVALELARSLRKLANLGGVVAVSGLSYASRLIRQERTRAVIATPADAEALIRRAVIKTETVSCVVLAWPELAEGPDAVERTEAVLADTRQAQRVVVTQDPGAMTELIERHAHRAPILRAAPLPETPIAPVRYAVSPHDRLGSVIRNALDILLPESTYIWDPSADRADHRDELALDPAVRFDPPDAGTVDLCVATDLPSAEVLAELAAFGRSVLLVVRAHQLVALDRLARSRQVLRLPGEADRAHDRMVALRQQIRKRLAGGERHAQVAALAPLFDEYDPAEVAAAAAGIAAIEVDEAPPDLPTWVRIRVESGKRDRIRPADLVGALIKAVGLPRDQVGRVEIRDAFSLVEVRAQAAERVLRALKDVRLKGRAVGATIDRR